MSKTTIDFNFKDRYEYLKFYKPFGVLCQFTREQEGQTTLKEYLSVGRDIYPIGRLDKDSEGLLLLSNDPAYNAYILSPSNIKEKEYYIQVEGDINQEAILKLQDGLKIKIKGKSFDVQATRAHIMEKTPILPDRNPPIRFRKNVSDSWASITLQEGKNRQVRRMLAAVGFPVLRLVRVRIDNIYLTNLKVGEFKYLLNKKD